MTHKKISFVTYDEMGTVTKAWSPSSELDWADAVAEGSDRADEAVDYLKASDDRPMFGRIVREAVAGGKCGTLTGFLDRIAERLRYIVPAFVVFIAVIGLEV